MKLMTSLLFSFLINLENNLFFLYSHSYLSFFYLNTKILDPLSFSSVLEFLTSSLLLQDPCLASFVF